MKSEKVLVPVVGLCTPVPVLGIGIGIEKGIGIAIGIEKGIGLEIGPVVRRIRSGK
jgi:hypothetical protein